MEYELIDIRRKVYIIGGIYNIKKCSVVVLDYFREECYIKVVFSVSFERS